MSLENFRRQRQGAVMCGNPSDYRTNTATRMSPQNNDLEQNGGNCGNNSLLYVTRKRGKDILYIESTKQKLPQLPQNFRKARQQLGLGGAVTVRQCSGLPQITAAARATLPQCRCRDCTKFSQDDLGKSYCEEGIGGTRIRFSDGHMECEPAPEDWHYCQGYDGPIRSKHVVTV
jgi:hypothetical protein